MKTLLAAILFLSSLPLLAQIDVDDRAGWKDRIFTGGGGGLGGGTDRYGNKYFSFSLSPVVGYMINSKISAGSSVSYQHVNYSELGIKYYQYGIMPFLRYNLEQLFLTTEINYLNIPQLDAGYDTVDRIFRTRWLAGAGYAVPLGSRSKLNMVGMYDLAYRREYFVSPWVFRVFFSL